MVICVFGLLLLGEGVLGAKSGNEGGGIGPGKDSKADYTPYGL